MAAQSRGAYRVGAAGEEAVGRRLEKLHKHGWRSSCTPSPSDTATATSTTCCGWCRWTPPSCGRISTPPAPVGRTRASSPGTQGGSVELQASPSSTRTVGAPCSDSWPTPAVAPRPPRRAATCCPALPAADCAARTWTAVGRSTACAPSSAAPQGTCPAPPNPSSSSSSRSSSPASHSLTLPTCASPVPTSTCRQSATKPPSFASGSTRSPRCSAPARSHRRSSRPRPAFCRPASTALRPTSPTPRAGTRSPRSPAPPLPSHAGTQRGSTSAALSSTPLLHVRVLSPGRGARRFDPQTVEITWRTDPRPP